MKTWDDARLLLAVVEHGSFSEAASHLELGQATVSRRIQQLELELGWPIFHRGRRGTTLTEQGALLLPAAQQMARWAHELALTAQRQEHQITGQVKIAAPPGVAYDFLLPFGLWMKKIHPTLRLELLVGVDYLDLSRGEADLAMRLREPTDPALVCLYQLSVPTRAYVAPSYLERLSPKPTLAELDWICWGGDYAQLSPRRELEASYPKLKIALTSDDYLLQRRACELGFGALALAHAQHPMLDYGALRALDLELPLIPSTLYLVCARSARHILRIKATTELLIEQLSQVTPGP